MGVQVHSSSRRESNIARVWRRHAKRFFILALMIFVLVLLTASTRMVQLAMRSQPDCVEHYKSADQTIDNRWAAKSSC